MFIDGARAEGHWAGGVEISRFAFSAGDFHGDRQRTAVQLLDCLWAGFDYFNDHGFFWRHLKRSHPETWEALGSPLIILNNTPKNNILTLKFLLGSSHRTLNDVKLNWYVWIIRGQILLTLLLMFLLHDAASSSR